MSWLNQSLNQGVPLIGAIVVVAFIVGAIQIIAAVVGGVIIAGATIAKVGSICHRSNYCPENGSNCRWSNYRRSIYRRSNNRLMYCRRSN